MKEKVILFDGKNLDAFVRQKDGAPAEWTVKDGVMTVTSDNIVSKYEYGDAHIHVEFRIPDMPEEQGQNKGNSGVYIQGCYELQVLDSYGVKAPRIDDCGAIYSICPPLTNASLAPLEWQVYDIYLKAAVVGDDGTVKENAVVTIVQNGQVIHNNLTLPSNTPGGVYEHVVSKGPLLLQDHGCPVSFRNVWVQPLN